MVKIPLVNITCLNSHWAYNTTKNGTHKQNKEKKMQIQKFLVVSLDEVKEAVTKYYTQTYSTKVMVEKVVKGEAKIPQLNTLCNDELLRLAWEHNLFNKLGEKKKSKAVVVELPEKYYLLWKAKEEFIPVVKDKEVKVKTEIKLKPYTTTY